MSKSLLSRRDFLKLLGAGAIVGVVGKFANFGPLNSQPVARADINLTLGSWAMGANTSIHAIHVTLLKNGKIMYAAGSGFQHSNSSGPFKAAVLDLGTNTETVTVMSDDLFCCGFSQLVDGTVLIAGGTKAYDDGPDGLFHGGSYAYLFDANSDTFIQIRSMAHGRWYPGMGTLPDGKAFVLTGYDEYGTVNALSEIYDPNLKSFFIKYDPNSSLTYCVGSGSTLPGAGSPCYGGPNKGVNPNLSLYPRTIIMPSGLVFVAGQLQTLRTWDPATGKWASAGNMISPGRTYGTAVLLPLQNTLSERGKILIAAGQVHGVPSIVGTAELLDFNEGTDTAPLVSSIQNMNYPRMYPIPVLLPTGQVILFGGTSGSNVGFVKYPELFDPLKNTWTSLNPATVGRQYHSIALLLPDGRVWTASGSPDPNSFEPRTEFFSPWYLFAGPRPTISGAPIVGHYGGTITIPTPDGNSIARVSLVKLGNTTHHFDAEHRLVWLQIQSRSGSNVVVSAPINANIAPPGYYMIHILNGSGVPSSAKIIRVGVIGNLENAPLGGISQPQNQSTNPPQNGTSIFSNFLHGFNKTK